MSAADVAINTAPDGTASDGSVDVNEVLAVTSETVEYAVYRPIAKEGQEPAKTFGFGILKDGNDLYKSVNGYKNAKGEDVAPDTELLRTAKVTIPIINKAEGIEQVVSDSDEAASIFMAGAKLKLTPQLRNKLTAVDEAGDFTFSGDEISYDECVDILNTPLQRRNLTDSQKALKALNNFNPDTLAAVLASMGYSKQV